MSLYVHDATISRLVRVIMRDGKKHEALRILDVCFAILRSDFLIEHPAAFSKWAIEKGKPLVEIRKYKFGERAGQVPVPCKPGRQESLAIRFIRYAPHLFSWIAFETVSPSSAYIDQC